MQIPQIGPAKRASPAHMNHTRAKTLKLLEVNINLFTVVLNKKQIDHLIIAMRPSVFVTYIIGKSRIIFSPTNGPIYCSYKKTVKAAFHFRVFHTHVYARKTLNPSTVLHFTYFKNTLTEGH